ncbi:MAG: RNA polymerase sigma factor [Clostridia bacterium]|nr:RNA polymerase sigma factor [Clostridia bacterium]
MDIDLSKLFEASECDKALVRIAAGNTDYLQVIQRYLQRTIYAVAYSVLRDFSLSDDAVQETYVRIIEKASMYTHGTSAKAWVVTMARNIALDMLKHRRYEYSDDDIGDLPQDRFDENSIVLSMQVKSALDSLDDDDRQIVTLKVYAGLKHSEIASIIGISTEAVKKKYQRALAKLKAELE